MSAALFDGDHVRFFSVQHNGQYVFVSNDKDGDGDRYVEAHPFADEGRNVFKVFRTDNGLFRFTNSATGHAIFVSQKKEGNDYVIEAHAHREIRNRFVVENVPAPWCSSRGDHSLAAGAAGPRVVRLRVGKCQRRGCARWPRHQSDHQVIVVWAPQPR
ncbi:hypothetical protein FraQA3DRAFT_1683 [Frankia sp. QA3]|nr:hypothetical protein FraQA3DRAFT_1683 [Frankia sp. QA3]